MKITVTEEILAKAKDYMPIAEKRALAKDLARECVYEEQSVDEGSGLAAFPRVYCEDAALKNALLLNVLTGYYLDMDYTQGGTIDEADAADIWGGSHVINQLERAKTNDKTRDKVFDILYDFKEFRKAVDVEIYNLRAVNNDVVNRLNATMGLASDPDTLKKLIEELKVTGNQLEEKIAERKEARESADET